MKIKYRLLLIGLMLCLPVAASAEVLQDLEAFQIFKRKVTFPYEASLLYNGVTDGNPIKVGTLKVTKESDVTFSIDIDEDAVEKDDLAEIKANVKGCKDNLKKNIVKNGALKLVISGMTPDGKLWDGRLYVPAKTDYFVPGLETFLKGCNIRAVEKNGKDSMVYIRFNGYEWWVDEDGVMDKDGNRKFSVREMVGELTSKKDKVKQTASNVLDKALKYDQRIKTPEGRAEIAQEYDELIAPVWEDLVEYSDELAERELSPVWMSRK